MPVIMEPKKRMAEIMPNSGSRRALVLVESGLRGVFTFGGLEVGGEGGW